MKNTLFQFSTPHNFECITDKKTAIRLENTKEKYENQAAYIDIRLSLIESIESLKGDSFLDKYIAWSEGFQTQVVLSEKTSFKRYTAYRVETKTDAVFQDQHFKINYVNLCVLLDDTWCVEYQFVYETKEESQYKALVESTLQSLEILGTANDWLQAYSWDIEEVNNEYLAEIQNEKEEKEKLENQRYEKLTFTPKETTTFKIGRIPFEMLKEETYWEITDKALLVNFHVQTKERLKAQKGKILCEYGDCGSAVLCIHGSKIYKNGVPNGTFLFKEGKVAHEQNHISVSLGDFGFDMAFSGYVYLQDGWVGINGWIESSYQKKSYRIQCYKQFDTAVLDWTKYSFTKAEFEQAPAEQVHYLNYNDSEIKVFPQKILECKNLKTLHLQGGDTQWQSNQWVSTYAPMAALPEEIAALTQLQYLSINNFEITQLPDTIGQLLQLNRFSLYACKIEQLPDSLLQLPRLEHLSVARTLLNYFPENIDLPQLKSVHLKHNQLQTLPQRLAEQPHLKSLYLEDNPWEYLPSAFNEIENIELSLEDKKRLLNYDYQGADGKGTVKWDDTVYFSEHDTGLIVPVKDILNALPNKEYNEAFISLCKRAIGLKETEKDTYQKLGNHRFGGYPDLPESIAYPRFGENWREDKQDYVYEFIAQINLEDVAHLQQYLPRKGMLYFFLSTIHDVFDDDNAAKVIWYHGDDPLVSGKNIQFEEDDFNEVTKVPAYTPYQADVFVINSMPSFYAARRNPHWFSSDKTKVLATIDLDYDLPFDVYDEIQEPIEQLAPHNYAINSHMFTQHENPELQAALKYKGNAEDWIILLKVTSSGDFQWGDAGDLAFVIHKSDLAKGDFSQVYVCIESS